MNTPGLNMELVHDFGEGVGVDMRDFTTNDKDDIDPELATPQLQTSGMSSIPPTSIMTNNNDDMFQAETGLDDDDDDEDAPKKRSKTTGQPGGFTYTGEDGDNRRKIRIEYINDKSRRHITFSKRKAGIMKKAYELSILTGTQILLLVVSETGLVYTFTTTKLQPIVQKAEGKNLIQACLNAPDGYGPDGQPLAPSAPPKTKNGNLAIRPHKLTAAASAALAAHAGGGEDGADAQAESQAALGVTTPNRPKKRLPSGKQKKGGASVTSPSDDVPPVPGIPDMHRGTSPGLGMSLASPISTSYTYPAAHHDYAHAHAHHGHPHPGAPGYGYPPEYSYGYPQHYPHMGVNPAGLQSPYHPPPHHAPQSSPGHRL